MELLLTIETRTSTPLAPKIGESFAGDVLVAQPDGFGWSVIEQINPTMRIIRVPITASEARALVDAERIPDNAPTGTIGQRRLRNIDLALLRATMPAGAKAAFLNDRRPNPILDATAFIDLLRAAVVQKPASF